MGIKVEKPRASLENLELTDEALMREVGLLAIEQIRTRTAQGIGSDGQPFDSYSPEYAAAKAAAVGSSGTPNLTLSGNMLRDLAIESLTKNSVTLHFKT